MKKEKIVAIPAALLMTALLAFPAMASEKIEEVTIDISAVLTDSDNLEVEAEVSDDGCYVDEVTVTNTPSGDWNDSTKPKVKVTLGAESGYTFSTGLGRSDVYLGNDDQTVTSVSRSTSKLSVYVTLPKIEDIDTDYDSDDDYRTVVGDLITYDVDGAKELLEEAKADGFDADATYEIIIKNDDELKLIAQAMQAMWKQNLGLNFTITTYESGSYWDEFYDGNFDVAFDGWTGDYDDPNTMLECFTQKACATQIRWSGEKAEEYDQIIADCATMTDQTERYAKFVEAEKILMDESPILPLYYRKSQLLVGTNVAKAVNDTLGHTLLMYTELS